MLEQPVRLQSRQQKSPAEGRALSSERFWESVLVSTPEVVSRTPHTRETYGRRKTEARGVDRCVSWPMA